jgi:uncharacterized membrane protein
MLRDLLRGKLFGHPIHVMLIHFPAALLPTAAVLDALRTFGHIGFSLDITLVLWPGVAIGWLAACFGIWDLVRLKEGSPEMSRALLHGGINATAVSGFTLALLIASNSGETMLRVAIELVCTALILAGNKFGGDLILRFGVGRIPANPRQD